jgi:hypothetical protein
MNRVALAAAGCVVLVLSACTHAAAPDASSTSKTAGKAIVPISCSQQFRTWSRGEGKGLMGALDAVSSAATAHNARKLTAALMHAKPAVTKGAAHPIPACADPRGYWTVLLMHVNAAASGKGSASSMRAAAQDLHKLHRQLLIEVEQTAQ